MISMYFMGVSFSPGVLLSHPPTIVSNGGPKGRHARKKKFAGPNSGCAFRPCAGYPAKVSNTQGQRYASLDGLRGVASLVVIGYHALLVVPAISALYVDKVNPAAFSLEWWLFHTPLRLLFAGHEAVLVFFVLSGFVLTLPFLKRPPTGRSTLAYYGR